MGRGGVCLDVGARAVHGHHDVRQLVVPVDGQAQRIGNRQQSCTVGCRGLSQGERPQEPSGRGEQCLALGARHFSYPSDHAVQHTEVFLVRALFGQRSARGSPAQFDPLVGVMRRTCGVQMHRRHRGVGVVQRLQKRKIHSVRAGWPYHLPRMLTVNTKLGLI
ncbi:hypothetical protein A3L22_26395 [Streptomyces griseus subsp. griseus]|nr:hypothetical protein A3L22_26395 [Streptomyces griseus subsp. griseus]